MSQQREIDPKHTLSGLNDMFRQVRDGAIRNGAMTESRTEDPRRLQAYKLALGQFGIPDGQIKTLEENHSLAVETGEDCPILPIVTISLTPSIDITNPEQQEELVRQYNEHHPNSELALALRVNPDEVAEMRKNNPTGLQDLLRTQILPNLHPFQIAVPLIGRRDGDHTQTSLDGKLAIITGSEYAKRLQHLADITMASSWVKYLADMHRYKSAYSMSDIQHYYPRPFRMDRILGRTAITKNWKEALEYFNKTDLKHDAFNQADNEAYLERVHSEIQQLCNAFHVELDDEGIPGFYQDAIVFLQKDQDLPYVFTTPFSRVIPIINPPKVDVFLEQIYQSGVAKLKKNINRGPSLLSQGNTSLETLDGFFREYAKACGDIHTRFDQGRASCKETVYGHAPWPYKLTIEVSELKLMTEKRGRESVMTEIEVEYAVAKATRGFMRLPQLPEGYPLEFRTYPDELPKLIKPKSSLKSRALIWMARHLPDNDPGNKV